MAPKHSTPKNNLPASSSDEEETSSSGEEESSSEDEQNEKTKVKASSPPQLTQTAKAVKKSDPSIKKTKSEPKSESETESESESDDVPTSNVKATASKQPMEETPAKSAKPKSKTLASNSVLGKCSTKRGSEVERDAKDFKRSKMKDSESNGAFQKSEDTKKHLFQRLWSEDDEVTLLKGMIDFVKKKGVDPTKDMNAYYDFIKKSLHFDVSLSQLKDKVWKLRKKFEIHASKWEKGEDKTFSKPHDQQIFDLSKKLWGSEGICGRSKSSTPMKIDSGVVIEEGEKAEKMGTETENHVGSNDTLTFDRSVGIGAMEDYVVNRGLDMVEGPKKSEMEEKWKKLRVAELKLFLERTELISEQVKLMLAAYDSV